jgi:hypothetical protein
VAVVSVKKGKTLWRASYGSVKDTASEEQQYTLNGNTFAYTSGKASSTGKKLCLRDVRTGKLREGELVRQKDPSQNPDLSLALSIQAHPRRDLVYLPTAQTVFFFSTTTANCIGRLSIPQLKDGNFSFSSSYLNNPLMLYFSESEPICGSSVREKFFTHSGPKSCSYVPRACHEFEIPTVEEVAATEVRLSDQEIPQKLSVFKPLRVQIYGVHGFGVNPFLKLEVDFFLDLRWGPTNRLSIRPLVQRSHGLPMVFDETGGEYQSNTPLEWFISQDQVGEIASKPKQGVPRGIRWGERRTECLFPVSLKPVATIHRQESYILFLHNEDVYFVGFEPVW